MTGQVPQWLTGFIDKCPQAKHLWEARSRLEAIDDPGNQQLTNLLVRIYRRKAGIPESVGDGEIFHCVRRIVIDGFDPEGPNAMERFADICAARGTWEAWRARCANYLVSLHNSSREGVIPRDEFRKMWRQMIEHHRWLGCHYTRQRAASLITSATYYMYAFEGFTEAAVKSGGSTLPETIRRTASPIGFLRMMSQYYPKRVALDGEGEVDADDVGGAFAAQHAIEDVVNLSSETQFVFNWRAGAEAVGVTMPHAQPAAAQGIASRAASFNLHGIKLSVRSNSIRIPLRPAGK